MEISRLNFKIRDAQKNDMKAVCEIFNEIIIHTTATFEEKASTEQAWMEIFETKKFDQLPFLVAEHNGLVIGYGTFGPFRKASGYKITVEHSLHVDQKYLRLGVGKALLSELIGKASATPIQNMIAAIDADNLPSLKLHEKFGFKIVGQMENVARKFSRDLTLVLLQLRLKK